MSRTCIKDLSITIEDSPLAYWPFDEASGAAQYVDDVNGVLILPNVAARFESYAGHLDGAVGRAAASTDFINMESALTEVDLAVPDLTKGLSMTFWFNLAGAAVATLPNWLLRSGGSTVNSFTNGSWNTGTNNISYSFSTQAAATIVTSQVVVLALNTWHFFAVTFDTADNKLRLSINNGAQSTSATTGTRKANSEGAVSSVIVAASSTANRKIDELKLWDKALSVAEIDAIYNL